MSEIVLVAIMDPLDNLSNKNSSSLLIEMFESSDIFKQISTLEIFHYDDNFHVFHGEAFVNLNDVVVSE